MNSLTPVSVLSQMLAPPDPDPPFSLDGGETSFDRLMDDLFEAVQAKSQPSTSAEKEEADDYHRKMMLLSGMVEQARNSWMDAEKAVKGTQSYKEQEYFLLRSKLHQVGTPDGVNNLV